MNEAAETTPPQIEILYFDDCPNHEAFLPHLRDLLARHDLAANLITTRIDSDLDAQHYAFLGSPTVRINGHDIDHDAESRTAYGMQCRLYRTPTGLTGTPPDAWILAALDLSPEAEAH
jgi:hypothetical protein